MEVSNLPDKEFKLMVLKMFTKFDKRVEELSKNFNKEIQNIKKKKLKKTNQSELKNTIAEMKWKIL